MWYLPLLLCLCSFTNAINEEHVHGMKNLIQGLEGVFPTCDIILFSEMVNFTTAEKKCVDFDMGLGATQVGNLATVNDDDKNRALKLLLNMAYKRKTKKKSQWDPDQWVWAGMRKVRNNLAVDTNKQYKASDWEWTDGSSPTTFKKWMKKQPDQKKDGSFLQNQMRINHKGQWDDTFTYKEHPYTCDYQGKYMISPKRLTWENARAACQNAGLDLAKVRNAGEIEEVINAAKYFLGDRHQKKFHHVNWIWIGGNDIANEGDWRWISDDSPIADFESLPWLKNMPDNAPLKKKGLKGQHALSISKWGKFDDSFIKVRKRGFACQCPNT